MKRRLLSVSFPLAALAGLLLATSSPANPDEGTVRGQVIDVSCYLAQGLHGDSHRACAEICGRDKGIPLAIVDEKGLVWQLVDSAMPGDGKN